MLKGSFPVDRFASLKTPFYYYDTDLLGRTLSCVGAELSRNPSWRMHYAVKANSNPAILKIISRAGFGADCVSGGEVDAAIKAGFRAEDIFLAGVGKSDEDIRLGLEVGIGRFNVESLEELNVISDLAASAGVVAPVSFRVNPDIGAHTHAKIVTGLAENKFGIGMETLESAIGQCLVLEGIRYCGLHFHIGSQILDMQDFVALCNRINSIAGRLSSHGLPLGDVDVGGGLGISYDHPNHKDMAPFESYFDVFRKHLCLPPDTPVHFELGRSIVGPCGSLISRVLFIKKGETRQFAIIDAGMTDLIRPALYHAEHRIENLSSDEPEEMYDVVGPVCESSDVFARGVMIDRCHRGDFIAIRSAGAYGESMSSTYNCRPLPGSCFSEM